MKLETVIPQTPAVLSSDQLEKMRRSVPLKIDPFGHWWHEGERFQHLRLIKAFNLGLGWTLDLPPLTHCSIDHLYKWINQWQQGEGKLTIQDRWCYLECDQTPFVGLSWKEAETLKVISNHQKIWEVVGFFEQNDVLMVIGQDQTKSILLRLDRVVQAQCIEWLEEVQSSYSTHPHIKYEIHFKKRVYPILPF